MDTKVLVFDSGKGGEYVQHAASKRFPDVQFDFEADNSGLPYGLKTDGEIIASAEQALRPVINDYDFVIIACHTLTEVGIDALRNDFPNTTLIGFDPGIKMAKDSGSVSTCVLATPASLQSKKYRDLKSKLSLQSIYEPDCSSWASDIEAGSFDAMTAIEAIRAHECDTVVLACTHYFWYEQQLKEAFPNKKIINPTQAVLNQFERLLTASRNKSPR